MTEYHKPEDIIGTIPISTTETEPPRPIVSIGGKDGRLSIYHNLNNNIFTFIIEDVSGRQNHAGYELEQLNHILIKVGKYLESRKTPNPNNKATPDYLQIPDWAVEQAKDLFKKDKKEDEIK